MSHKLLRAQQNEINEHHVYLLLAKSAKDKKNRKVLEHISRDELRHYSFWKKYTAVDVQPQKWIIWWHYFIARVFGLTFGIKLMEKGEITAQSNYKDIAKEVPSVKTVMKDEEKHEHALVHLLQEDKLRYVGSIVLGLNDALVELTGALAGLTFALENPSLIAITGLITGIAASLSMAASEYLSKKADSSKHAIKASVYTGIAYIITVLLLIMPYFIFSNVFVSLGVVLLIALLIIFLFNFYLHVIRGHAFWKKFLEMVIISMGVAGITFMIGYLVKIFLGVSV